MKLKMMSILMASVYGCQTAAANRTKSNWDTLSHADKVDCHSWPLRPQDLQLDDILLLQGTKPAAIVSGLNRSGTPIYYYSDLSNSKPDPEEFSALNFGHDAVILGGAQVDGEFVAVIAHSSDSQSQLEIRRVPQNTILLTANLGKFYAAEGQVFPTQSGFWLSIRSDDHKYFLIFIGKGMDGKFFKRDINLTPLLSSPLLFPDAKNRNALMVWREATSPHTLNSQLIAEDGTSTKSTPIVLPINQVESWNAYRTNQDLFLAIIDGDTVIGQAELKLAKLSSIVSAPQLQWTHTQTLNDLHTTEPLFLDGLKGLEVLVLNWIDEESTIARYSVGQNTLSSPRYSGVFQKGTRILGTQSSTTDGTTLITRVRDGIHWAFKLCWLDR